MKINLTTRNRNRGFHLRGVQSVRGNKQLLVGKCFHEIYEKTRFKDMAHVKLEIKPNELIKAYYLYDDHEEVGIAFVPCDGQSFQLSTKNFQLEVSDARHVHFQSYDLADKLLSHVLAHYLKDGMPL